MHEVQKLAVQKAIRTLEAMKDHVQFAVEFNDEVFGNRTLAPVKAFKRQPRYPYGATRKYYSPFFEGAKVGDVIEVPFGEFDGRVLSANISAACIHAFGKGNTTVHKNDKTGKVEVLITGMDPSAPNASDFAKQMEMFDVEQVPG